MKEVYHTPEAPGYGYVSLQREGEISYSMKCINAPATWEEVKKLLPRPVTADMRKRQIKALDAFLFVKPKEKGKRQAYCTACGRLFDLKEEYKHGKMGVCPKCKAETKYFEAWRGRGKCVCANYYAFWRKSPIDKMTVFQIGVICERDFSEKIDAAPEFILSDVTMFREKRAPAKFHAVFRYHYGYYVSKCGRAHATRLGNGAGYYYDLRMDHFECKISLKEAARGTQLGRCGIGETNYKCLEKSWAMYELVALCMRYPSVEYLYKTGQLNLISQAVEYGSRDMFLNLNGKTAKDVLGLTPPVLNEIKKRKIELNRNILMARAAFDQRGDRYDLDDLISLNKDANVPLIMEIDTKIKIPIKRMVNYLHKQRRKDLISSATHEWRDYLKQCIELGMDISDESISMPKDLHAAHQELTQRIEYKRNAEYDEQIKKRADKLREYCFEAAGMLMRPFMSGNEIIEEGNALHHCVGGYVRRYAEGGTILCAVRRAEAPDIPWYTVEFAIHGSLVQCRGMRNITNEEDRAMLDEFWTAFDEHRTKKARKSA